ncbi:MAG: amidase family protein, partial [Elusimicrobiota bacterium]
YLSDVFTIPSNLAGNTSVSIPCGFSKNGLPIGLQLIGDVFQEKKMLSAAKAYEAVKPFALLK